MSDVDEQFQKITDGLDIDWDAARKAPTVQDYVEFGRREIDSPAAVGGAPVHPTHRPQSQEEAASNGGVRFCLRCCVRIDTGYGSATSKAVAQCPGKRTIIIDDRGQLRWMPVPEVGR